VTAVPSPADLRPFQEPSLRGSIWQIANSVVPYVGLWVLMTWTVSFSYPLTLALAVLASGFLVRVFIIFHDCGHGSFFRSRRANEWVGFLTGMLTLTPFRDWWYNHSLHHSQTGHLDKRGYGDVWTMTVEEFRAASRWDKLRYICVREPIFMFGVGSFFMFAFKNRLPNSVSRPRERRAVLLTNLALAAIVTTLCLTIGWKTYLAIHIPIIVVAGAAGIWLFYVQHQFEATYWEKEPRWDYATAALTGSSYYRLPRVLQWFSGNIGFHHVHHLSPKIPNYRLQECHRTFPQFQRAPRLSLRESLRCAQLRLWDEEGQRLVGWREAAKAGRPAG